LHCFGQRLHTCYGHVNGPRSSTCYGTTARGRYGFSGRCKVSGPPDRANQDGSRPRMWREPSSAAGDDDSPCQGSFRSRRVRTRVTKPESRVRRSGALGRTPQARFCDPLGSAGPDAAIPTDHRIRGCALPPIAPMAQAGRSPSVTMMGIRVCADRLPGARLLEESDQGRGARSGSPPRPSARTEWRRRRSGARLRPAVHNHRRTSIQTSRAGDTSARDATPAEAPRRCFCVPVFLCPGVSASRRLGVSADNRGGVTRFTCCQFLAQSIFIFASTVVT
jgi:hypothetical protein